MSWTRFERSFVLPAPDPRRRAAVGGAVLAAGLAFVVLAPISPAWRTGLLAWGAVCALRLLGEVAAARRAGPARWRPGRGWTVEHAGAVEPAEVAPGTRVHGRRVVLFLRTPGGRSLRYDPGPADLCRTAHRRLRALLRTNHG